MTTTEQRPQATEPCPSWCVRDQREDSKHAEDRYTRHRAEDVVVTMSRSGFLGGPPDELTLSMDHMAFDVPIEDEWGPTVYFHGDDGSGSLMQLSLKVEDAEKVAAELSRLAEVARSVSDPLAVLAGTNSPRTGSATGGTALRQQRHRSQPTQHPPDRR